MWKEEIDKYFVVIGAVAIAVVGMIILPKEQAMPLNMVVLSSCFALAGTGKKPS